MPGEPATVAYFLVTGVSDSFMIAVIWAGVFLYPNALRAVHARERALEDARRDAELLRLRSHLEPHFVLNTLNAIAGMVVDEPRVARRLLGALGDLFRDAVSDRSCERRSVRDELAWLERYAAIVQARYGDALRFEWDVEERAMEMEIPRLLLQPIVENAVAHGALRRSEGGTVRVRVRRDGASLRCEVEDDGPGPSDAPRREGARGLSMVERRLALEAPGSELVLGKTASGGALAVLRIMQRTES
jgi:LytS/YehU family sensor histidine kinase